MKIVAIDRLNETTEKQISVFLDTHTGESLEDSDYYISKMIKKAQINAKPVSSMFETLDGLFDYIFTDPQINLHSIFIDEPAVCIRLSDNEYVLLSIYYEWEWLTSPYITSTMTDPPEGRGWIDEINLAYLRFDNFSPQELEDIRNEFKQYNKYVDTFNIPYEAEIEVAQWYNGRQISGIPME